MRPLPRPTSAAGRRAAVLTIGVALTVIVGATLALGTSKHSGASVTSTTKSVGNSVAGGAFSFDNSAEGEVIIDATDIYPGESVSNTVTLTGAGDYGGAYALAKSSVTGSPALASALTLTLKDGAGTTLYGGTVQALSSVNLGTIAVGGSRTYTLTVAFPAAAASPSLQGETLTAVLAFSAVAQ